MSELKSVAIKLEEAEDAEDEEEEEETPHVEAVVASVSDSNDTVSEAAILKEEARTEESERGSAAT